MDDETAFLELVRSNNQSELTNLERGIHHNRSGIGSTEYAKAVGVTAAQVTYDGGAAEVYEAVLSQLKPEEAKALRTGRNQHLYTIKTAAVPEWLWVDLVRRMLDESWNVGTTKDHAGRFKDVPDPPPWADRDALARDIVEGSVRPGGVARPPPRGVSVRDSRSSAPLPPPTTMSSSLPTRPPWRWPELVAAPFAATVAAPVEAAMPPLAA